MKNLLICFALLSLYFIGCSSGRNAFKRDYGTFYYDTDWEKTSKDSAAFYSISIKDSLNPSHDIVTSYSMDGKLTSIIHYKGASIDGELLTYYPNGKLKRKDIYKDDEEIEGKCFTITGKETTHTPYRTMPEYPGGDKVLLKVIQDNVIYPETARINGVEGRVFVSFYVNKDGRLSDFKIHKGIDTELNNEALRIMKYVRNFIPGKIDNEVARVKVIIPIHFQLH